MGRGGIKRGGDWGVGGIQRIGNGSEEGTERERDGEAGRGGKGSLLEATMEVVHNIVMA